MDLERDFERCDESVGGHRIGDVRNYDIASPPALAHFLANPMRSQTLLRVGSTNVVLAPSERPTLAMQQRAVTLALRAVMGESGSQRRPQLSH